jgi:hypothetical protein
MKQGSVPLHYITWKELQEGNYVNGVVDSKNQPLGYIRRISPPAELQWWGG